MSKMVGGSNMVLETKKEEFKAFKELIKRYEKITRKEIAEELGKLYDKNDYRQSIDDLDEIKNILTGFGSVDKCILCNAAGYDGWDTPRCNNCDWKKLTGSRCNSGKNYLSFDMISMADTIEDLYRAYQTRSKYMKKVLKKYEEEHKLPEMGKCPYCGSDDLIIKQYPKSIIGGWKFNHRSKVCCNNCECEGPTSKSKKKAINEWNKIIRMGQGIDGNGEHVFLKANVNIKCEENVDNIVYKIRNGKSYVDVE